MIPIFTFRLAEFRRFAGQADVRAIASSQPRPERTRLRSDNWLTRSDRV